MQDGAPAAVVPLPRALDVQRFAGAREQEIRALCTALKGSALGGKFGVAALPRHLRRRAGSHKPYHGHRFRPNAKLQGKRRKLAEAEEGGEAQEGAAEHFGKEAEKQQHGERAFTNRRMRRQPAALQQQHRQSAAWTEASLAAPAAAEGPAAIGIGNGIGNGSSCSSGLRRLETHVWHAKRLSMEERFGWLLPAGAAGQGRGSRSFAHSAKASALMHDASYLCPLLLRGAWSGVHSVLSALLDPAESGELAADWAASCPGSGGSSGSSSSNAGGSCAGGWEQAVMLHQPGSFPRGAICPAQLLLAPSTSSGSGNAMDVDGGAAGAAADAAAGGGSRGSGSMQACLWLHPAAAAEAHAALRSSAIATGGSVSIALLNLRRLEIRGGAADKALAVALAGATARGSSGSSSQQQQDAQQQPADRHVAAAVPPLPAALAGLQHGAAVQLLLSDPRLRKPVALGSAAASLLPMQAACQEPPHQHHHHQQQPVDLQRLQQSPLPLSEAELSVRRQRLRRQMLQLSDPAPAPILSSQLQQGQQQGQGEDREEELLQRRGQCPAVVVRHDPPEACGIPGWSLILPPGWVAPLWLAAAYAGCRPAGQREWRWLHRLQEQAFFPWDHPDTAGYAALMQQQQSQRAAAAAKRPAAKQALAAPPTPPQWERLLPAAAAATAEQPQQPKHEQQQPQQGQEAMEVDTAANQAPAAAPATAEEATDSSIRLFVARSYAAMAAALGGSDEASSSSIASSSASAPASEGNRPIAAALRQGLLQWRPKQQADALAAPGADTGMTGGRCCFVEATVQPIKAGTAAEGAAVCFVAGRETLRHRLPLHVLTPKQQWRQQRDLEQQQAALVEASGDPAAAAGAPSGSSEDVAEEAVHVIGHVLSEVPRGAPHRCASLAVVRAEQAWRLRSLQHWGPRQDGGAVEAFVRNPGTALLYPVRLRLLVEQAPR